MASKLFGCVGAPSQGFILVVIGVLLFGRRLPEVARSLGQHIREFKRGLVGIEEDIWASPAASIAGFAETSSEAAPPLIERDPAGV